MEKIGLIANEFTPFFRNLTEELFTVSDGTYYVGYCRSIKALEGAPGNTDAAWAAARNNDHPERFQELLRNCDLLLCEASKGSYLPELPMMSARGTVLCYNKDITAEELTKWVELSKGYHTSVGLIPITDDISAAANMANSFYKTGVSPLSLEEAIATLK